MNKSMSELVELYGRRAGIKMESIGNDQVRYRLRENAGVLGTWVPESNAKNRLLQVYEREVLEHNRELEDAFGDENIVSIKDLKDLGVLYLR